MMGVPSQYSTPSWALPSRCPIRYNQRQLTQTVGAPSEAWRFSQGESPCRTRPNQPFVPSVAVMKEAAKVG